MKTFKEFREACWDGYKQVGLKKKGDCVPVGEDKIEEKNVPTNPTLWSKAKSLAKSNFVFECILQPIHLHTLKDTHQT
jgi:hypothetical protein